MQDYNAEQAEKDLKKGKSLLDIGHFRGSILIFDNLIKICEQHKENEDALLTLEGSLNNRGVALCKLGRITQDKAMYLKGVDDFKASYNCNPADEVKEGLVAFNNYNYSQEELKTFDNIIIDKNNILQAFNKESLFL